MKSARVLTVVFLVVLAGILTYLTSTAQQAQCEVCMVFKGRRNCATAAARSGRGPMIRSPR